MMRPESYFPRSLPIAPVGLAEKRRYKCDHLEGGCLLIRLQFGAVSTGRRE